MILHAAVNNLFTYKRHLKLVNDFQTMRSGLFIYLVIIIRLIVIIPMANG